jgi:hypothetical protein
MFEVKTIIGSFVKAKIAGTESTAKIMSVSSRKEQRDEQRRGVNLGVIADEKFCP